MSDRLAAKIKENAGKQKYSSLNLNQTYKGNKVEIKTSTGATRHGLQSLGKIGSSRRIPPPANLPSLKSENSGNDPTVSLVPSGGGGWGSTKEKTDNASTPQHSSSPSPTPAAQTSQGSVPTSQQPVLQPQRPIQPSSYPSQQPQSTQQQSQSSGPTRQEITTTTQQEKTEAQTKTWGTVSQSEAGGQVKTYSHQPTPYFNREFPTLGGQDNGETKPERKEISHGQGPIIRNTHEPPWMERSGPGPPPHGYGRDHEIFNGGPGQYHRRPPPDYQHGRGGSQNYQSHHYNNSYYPPPGSRMPPYGYAGPDQHGRPYQRPGPGQRPGTRPDKRWESERDIDNKPVIRPSVLRPEDIQAMDDEDDDGGWAGAHGEVDYSAKLNFEDFDEDEKDRQKDNNNKEKESSRQETEDKIIQKHEEKPDTRQEPEQAKEPVQFKRPQDTERPPQQPKPAWGEPPQGPPQGPPQYRDDQYGREGRPGPPQSMRPFDSHRPPQGQGYHSTPPWNMQYPTPQQRIPKGQYPPVSGSPPGGRGPHGGSPKQDTVGPPVRREGEPIEEWTARRQKQQEEMHAAVERARKRREQEELELQAKTKAAAMMKLKALEEKGKATGEKAEEPKESVAEKPRADSTESGKSERETRSERDKGKDENNWERGHETEPASLPTDHKSGYKVEDSARRRNDSDSSDASRSSGSRQFFHHQQRNIPPRFQQQRQQQQQQYQQQQLYQATHPVSHPQRESYDVPPDSGPVSPSGSTKSSRPADGTAPKRIMKRSDSSSTAGDDVASVKSIESTGDKEKGSRQRLNSGTTSSLPEQDAQKPIDSPVKNEEKVTRKGEVQDEKKSRDSERQPEKAASEQKTSDRPEQDGSTAPQRKREYRSGDRKSSDEVYKRKRDENEEGEYDERRSKITTRDRQTEGRGRLRQGSGLRGRGRGVGRGRQEYRSGGSDRQRGLRDSRQRGEYRDYKKDEKTERTREPLRTEDRNKEAQEKVPSEEREEKGKPERPPQKKEEKVQSERESQERKPPHQEKTRDFHEKEKRPDRKNEKYEKRDEREQRSQRKTSETRKTDKENRGEMKKSFASRDIREEEGYKASSQRSGRDGDRYQDRRQDRNRERDSDYYKDRPRERDRDLVRDRDRTKSKDYDRVRPDYKEPVRSPRGHERGGHRGQVYGRGRGASARVGRRGSGRLVGSGRITQRTPRKEELSFDEDVDDDSASESSSYTTATSASEERIEEKEEKPKERPRSASQSGAPLRTPVRSTRGVRAGRGNFVRSRREQEKPPRFQKQQERAAAQRGTSGRGGYRSGDRDAGRGSRSRGRGRGRGRGIPSSRDYDDKDEGSVQPSEDWEEEVNPSPKDQAKEDKSSSSQKKNSRPVNDRYANRRTSSRDDSGKQGPRRDGGQSNNQSRKGDPFLVEKQVKVEGSRLNTAESKGALPAGKSTDLAQSKKSSGTPKEEKRTDYSAVDNIDSKTQKRTDSAIKKANIQLYDLHNVAGVICIDDIADDASDISSSGFVEVTSKRAQKELKEKQREEDERRKRNEEKASQRNTEKAEKFKKNQASKPPRFSKQHQVAPAPGNQGKVPISKIPAGVGLEGIAGISGGIGSNSSSTNSTKRNSPVTVERPLSPHQSAPIFNAWNKPLNLVNPAKPPGSSLVITSNVQDPLAVGSGKPSRQPQPKTVIPVQNSLINSNIEDKSVDDEYEEITKEIESMAPTEEQEELHLSQEKIVKKSDRSTATSGARERRQEGEKKSQTKPQKERPRFDKPTKRKSTTDDGVKKEYTKHDDSKKEKSRLSSKPSDVEPREPTSDTKKTSSENKISDAPSSDKEVSESLNKESTSETQGIKLTKSDDGDGESEKDSVPRKDSDYSVDSEGQASGDSSMFSSRPLSVDIDSSGETQEDRPPTPVSPAYAEMSKRVFAARKAWDDAPTTSHGLAPVSMESSSSWPETSSSSRGSKDSGTIVESSQDSNSESRETAEVSVSKADVTKPAEVQFSAKKTGGSDQQNVCKVKPQQQQQPIKPQQTSAVTSVEERRQPDRESMVTTQPVLPQDHLLRQNVHATYPFQIDPQVLQLQQQQPQQFIPQPIQPLPQSAQVAANTYQLSSQMHQVRQPTAATSLSQSPQELFQPSFMTNNLYTTGGFPVSQPFVSISMVATTTTPSYVSTSTRTQATSVMALQGQQHKTINSSMFGPSRSPAQTVYMPFDPQNMGGTAALLNFNQQSQAQRQMLNNQAVGFTDVMTQQAHLQHSHQPQASPQQVQNAFSFHTKPTGFDSQHSGSLKSVEPTHGEYNHPQSELVKHINAKPFEPPKRLSTPTPISTANSGMGLLTSAMNPNVVHLGPSPPNMGTLSHSPPMQTSYISNRPVSMSPVDPNVSFSPAAANSFVKHAPMGHFQLSQQQRQQPPVQQFTPFQQQPVHIKPQQLQQHQAMNIRAQSQPSQHPTQQQHNVAHMPASGVPPQAIMHGRYGGVGPSQSSTGNQRFPGPIQRPPTSGVLQGMPQNISQHQPRPIQPPRPVRQQAPRMPHAQKAPILSTRPQMPSQMSPQIPVSSQGNPFKAMQHQKMLEETRNFFATDQQTRFKPQTSPSGTDSSIELKGQVPQQQMAKQGQAFQQPLMKQQMPMQQTVPKHQNVLMQETPKASSQHRQPLQHKQVPLAPASGVHNQNKPPRMSQENKPKQTSQEKKDKKEDKSHIIELPRKKPQDNINKSKPSKVDSPKSDDVKQASRTDGKPASIKRSGPIRVTPMIQKTPAGNGRSSRLNKPRPPPKSTGTGVPANKPKADGTTTATTATAIVATGATTKPQNEAVVSSKGKDLGEASPKDSEEVKAPNKHLTNELLKHQR